MVVGEASINNIMDGIPNTGVRLHTYKKKLKQRFDIIKRLGQGTYGKVKLGINKETGQEVAIKTIKKSKIETEADLIRIRREIQIMSSVRHPNIVHIYEVFENREKMVLVMEYAAGGELYDYLSERKVLAEEEARRIFRQIAIACYYCHKHKICHRDLKLENILLDEEGNAKIADFGLSNVYDDTRLLSTFCGSPLYASPEIVKGTPYHGPEVDCWSLGVLLYTLVYGAMPFDGSNFKRLVKQISQGDYFEPRTPSPASPLIKEMLTVNPKTRADIEQICSHWWVNEGYDESALEISEYLANQTPVRLDYLLSLAPPPTKIEGDNLVVTGDVTEEPVRTDNVAPTRSQSVGSLMELTHPAEKRINDMLKDAKPSPKRKLESTVSTDQINQSNRKDKIIKENTIADISVHATIHENASLEDASMSEPIPLDKSRTQTLSKEMDVEPTEDVSQQGAVCAELIEEAKTTEKAKKPVLKIKKTISTTLSPKKLEEINENPSQENLCDATTDKENKVAPAVEGKPKDVKESEVKSTPVKKKPKKVLTDKVENRESPEKKVQPKSEVKETEKEKSEVKEEVLPPRKDDESEEMKQDEAETKPLERRRSRIYEQAEKFQNLISASESKGGVPEKPKKVVLPGVSVDGYKKQFERKCSLTSTSPPKTAKCSIPKRISIDKQSSTEKEKSPETAEKPKEKVEEPKNNAKKEEPEKMAENNVSKPEGEDDVKKQLKNAVNVISSALEKDGARKSKSRPCIRKPPVPFGVSGRSASGSISMITSPLSPDESPKTLKVQIGPNNDMRNATVQVSTPEVIKYDNLPETESKTSSAEITLKSATLPRRKTSKAEIHLNYPQPKPASASIEFKTEMAHRVEVPPKLATQRSEAVFPVSAAPNLTQRSASVEPESKIKPKERIIPIAIEKQGEKPQAVTSPPPPPVKPPTPKVLQNQKSYQSQRSNSLSRQSTQESDSETTVSGSGEPIRKSPREYIIPIAVEGGGYVTPRAGSLEPSDSTASTMTNSSRRSKLSRNVARRMNSLMSDRDGSEDESLFSLHRHSSFGRDSDNEEGPSRKDTFPMHKLRSSRLRNLEHTDSVSSGEDDDDDGFDIMTSEKLFSSLLSRVKDLTQRINVDDRPGFPSSRLMSHFDHGTNFWNFKSRLDPFSSTTPLGRTVSQERSNSSSLRAFGAPWRRSVSRDLATDIDSVLGESRTPTQTQTLPRGDTKSKPDDDLNLSDLDLKQLKLSEEDAIALSYLTPGLSRRIQKQLLAQLPPSEAKKLTRTMSMRNSRERTPVEAKNNANVSTLPRRYSVEPEAKDKVVKRKDPLSYTRSTSLREPRTSYVNKSEPESTNSEDTYKPNLYSNDYVNLQRPSLYQSLYTPESSSLSKYLSPKFSETPAFTETDKKTDTKTPSTMPRKISRFLRPDFYDKPKDESAIVKEKKEREMETQKVLKEIRDKRKGRLNLRRERSASRDTSKSESTESKDIEKPKSPEIKNGVKDGEVTKSNGTIPKYANLEYDKHGNLSKIEPVIDKNEDTNQLLNNVSDSIKTIETNIIAGHDYVNVPPPVEENFPKKEKISRLVRPKSYPTDTTRPQKIESKKELKKEPSIEPPETTSKVKIKKEPTKIDVKNKSPPKVVEKPSNKNRFLQSIEKKFEKLRGLNNGNSRENSVEKKTKDEKKSTIDSAIKKLREQSLPRNMDHCITESGLIKRAVSVEDLTTLGPGTKELQPSRKSVTKILGLFKKYEEKDKKSDKGGKLKKPKESNADKVGRDLKSSKKNGKSSTEKISSKSEAVEKRVSPEKPNLKETDAKERPKSMFYDIGNKTDDTRNKNSKLPVNSFRRSLNLDKTNDNKVTKNRNEENGHDRKNNNSTEVTNDFNDNPKPDRKNLKLDLTNTSDITEGLPSTSSDHRNSTATDDSSLFLSPCDDNMSCCDSWSVCSDYHTNDLTSPISANGNLCSGDESESVIDRIRRKSFYTRFNEKKKPRKPSVSGNYRDLDLYKDYNRKGYSRTPTDYSSLDRRSVDYRFPSERRLSYTTPEPAVKKEYKPYGRSSSLLNDYVNVPNRYQTYNPRLTRHISSLYSPDAEDTVDNVLTAGKSRLSSYHYQPSRMNGRASSVSPSIDKLYSEMSPSSLKGNSTTNSSSQMT